MPVPSFLTPTELRERSDFTQVTSKTDQKLALLIFRAHGLAQELGTLPQPESFDDTEVLFTYEDTWTDPATPTEPATVELTLRDIFLDEMKTAIQLIVERLVFAARTTAADAAGIVAEDIGDYSYSRASSGGRTGEPVEGTILTDEVRKILARWVTVDEFDAPLLQRTDVFLPTPWYDEMNPLRGLVVDEILEELSLRASQRQTSAGGNNFGD